ncbi:MAG: DUF192 domain-containing protein [Candidatus Baltobacteraceae bacterium]
MKVINKTSGRLLATSVQRAESAWMRAAGFIGRAEIAPQEGLWFDRCRAIHTLGVRAPLDVLFLDDRGRVLEIAVVPPAKIAVINPHAATVVEFGHGAICEDNVVLGDQIELMP